MYDFARKTRAERRAKAERLGASTERKTDSSDWTPAEPLNTDAKTGMRPVSRRAYKDGGKVDGCGTKANMGRKPRKAGGRAEGAKDYAEAKVNRNVKEANEKRAGIKHVGGLKTGGRAGKMNGGVSHSGKPYMSDETKKAGEQGEKHLPKSSDMPKSPPLPPARPAEKGMSGAEAEKFLKGRKHGGRTHKADGGSSEEDKSAVKRIIEDKMRSKRTPYENDGRGPTETAEFTGKRSIFTRDNMPKAMRHTDRPIDRKAGGRTKKADGGNIVEQATKMLDKSAKTAGVPGATMSFGRITKGTMSPARAVGMKKGGEAHTDEAMDRALIKKMVKPEARKGKESGGKAHADEAMDKALIKKMVKPEARTKRATGGSVENRTVHKTDGEFHYPEKDYGQLASTSAMTRKVQERTPLKTGGRAKGKTDINIIIATGAKPMQPDAMMPPPGMDMGMPPGMPIPVPGAPGAAAPPPMPMPMPMPMPAAGGPGAGAAPMPRKSGGRAMSFKDMTAGAGSGEGRLQKTDIAEYKREKRRAGGKVYKSYEDMDAGAGSGLGRLEKTEIQARKR